MTETITRDRTDTLEISLNRSEEQPEPSADERVRRVISEAKELPELPMQLIEKYCELAARHATSKRLADGEWFATILGFEGVWAKEPSEQRALEVLEEVVLDWTLLKIQHKDKDLPVIEEIDLNVL